MIKGYYILNEDHTVSEVSVTTRVKWFEEANRCVRDAYIPDEFRTRVSTVFLGANHNFTDDGPPILFETMVFGGPMDGEQERYHTRDEAVAGHERIVARFMDLLS